MLNAFQESSIEEDEQSPIRVEGTGLTGLTGTEESLR